MAPSTCSERIRRLQQSEVVTGLHAAVDLPRADLQALHSFLVAKLSSRREVIRFRSSIVYAHGQKRALEDLNALDG